jgi:hypothetical protein
MMTPLLRPTLDYSHSSYFISSFETKYFCLVIEILSFMSHSFALIFLYMSTLYQLSSSGTHSSPSFSFISTHPPAHPRLVLLARPPFPADVQGDDVALPLVPSLPDDAWSRARAALELLAAAEQGHSVRWITGSTVGVRMRPLLCSTRLRAPCWWKSGPKGGRRHNSPLSSLPSFAHSRKVPTST